MKQPATATAILLCIVSAACNKSTTMQNARRDIHSYSNPEQIRVHHLDLDCDVLFDRKILKGTATLSVERRVDSGAPPLILDTRNLHIEKVEVSDENGAYAETKFVLGASDPILGAPLTITIPPATSKVRVHYSTSPEASALQWLDPPQTAGRKRPFLFTQSQAIHSRSWIPLQDSPGVRMTYSAVVRTPKDLRAVMSAPNDPNAPPNGEYRFRQRQAIPSYLIALAVGDLQFRPIGRRTGVYAEPSVADRAAAEFADTEQMLAAARTWSKRWPSSLLAIRSCISTSRAAIPTMASPMSRTRKARYFCGASRRSSGARNSMPSCAATSNISSSRASRRAFSWTICRSTCSTAIRKSPSMNG